MQFLRTNKNLNNKGISEPVQNNTSIDKLKTLYPNIDIDNVGRWAEARSIPYTTFADLSQKDKVIELIRTEIENVNKTLPQEARIKRFLNLTKEFDADEAELTRTRKLRRAFLEDRYRDNLIDALYSDNNEYELETVIAYRDGRQGVVKKNIKIASL